MARLSCWINGARIKVIASDGAAGSTFLGGLEDHPSATPKWDVMCAGQNLLWEDEDACSNFTRRSQNT
jgi:hypothetical protein